MTSTLIEPKVPLEAPTKLERWKADPTNSSVDFEVDHFWGLHTVRGHFLQFDGSYVVAPAGQKVELTVDAASIDTGIAARDRHLRSADFFNVAEHPQVHFASTRITGLGDGRVRVHGNLDVAGTSVPLTFDASVKIMSSGALEIEATTTVDQLRFGIQRGPLRNVRTPARLHVKAHLVRDGSR